MQGVAGSGGEGNCDASGRDGGGRNVRGGSIVGGDFGDFTDAEEGLAEARVTVLRLKVVVTISHSMRSRSSFG